MSLRDLRRTYRDGTTTPRAVIDELWPRMDEERAANVWIALASLGDLHERCDDLSARADEIDRMPLWGIPFAVKDNIDVAGWETTAGCPAFAYTAEATAPAVQRLLDAGAILIGKTNLDQFATGLVGTRSPYGVPTNPHDPTLPPGGSSSGSAVAVALGLVAFALGTDTAGSGRVPTVFTGTVGLKPAAGRWSTEGVVPACRSLDCISVFASSIADADAVAGVIGGDTWGAVEGGVRVGVPTPAVMEQCDPAVVTALSEQIERLARAGHEVVEVDLRPFLAAGTMLYDGPWVAERTAAVGEFIRDHPDDVEPIVAQIILSGFDVRGVDVVRGYERLEQRRREMAAVWEQVDVLATPTVPYIPTLADIAAQPIDANRRLGLFTHPTNLLGLCSLSVPGPRGDDRGPSGLTVVAPPGREPLVGAVARTANGEAPELVVPRGRSDTVDLVVVGAHLLGHALNHQLIERGGAIVGADRTAPFYRLHHLAGDGPDRPGLERVAADGDGVAIEVEVWRLPAVGFADLVTIIPPPLGIGSLELSDGRWLPGFICEPIGLAGATDISDWGGWARYRES